MSAGSDIIQHRARKESRRGEPSSARHLRAFAFSLSATQIFPAHLAAGRTCAARTNGASRSWRPRKQIFCLPQSRCGALSATGRSALRRDDEEARASPPEARRVPGNPSISRALRLRRAHTAEAFSVKNITLLFKISSK